MLVFAPQPHTYAHYHQPSMHERYMRTLEEERERTRQQQLYDLANQYYQPQTYYDRRRGNEYELDYGYDLDARRAELYRQRQSENQRQRELAQQEAISNELRRRRYDEALSRAYREGTKQAQHSYESRNRDCESPRPTRKAPSPEERDTAARLIQTTFRSYRLRKNAYTSITSLRSSLDDFKSSFTYPSSPAFLPNSTLSAPKLAYDSTNTPVHAFEDSLMKLLSKLDTVESGGDKRVRTARKALAKDIAAALEAVDAWKVEEWKKTQVQEQRSRRDDHPLGDDMQEPLFVPTESVSTIPFISVPSSVATEEVSQSSIDPTDSSLADVEATTARFEQAQIPGDFFVQPSYVDSVDATIQPEIDGINLSPILTLNEAMDTSDKLKRPAMSIVDDISFVTPDEGSDQSNTMDEPDSMSSASTLEFDIASDSSRLTTSTIALDDTLLVNDSELGCESDTSEAEAEKSEIEDVVLIDSNGETTESAVETPRPSESEAAMVADEFVAV